MERDVQMSACSTNAWRTPRWTTQVWHTPNGRDVHVSEHDEPHEVTAHLSDGNEWTHYHNGAPVAWFEDGGTRYLPVHERDWDDGEVTD